MYLEFCFCSLLQQNSAISLLLKTSQFEKQLEFKIHDCCYQ